MLFNSFGTILFFLLSALLAKPLGAYMSKVYNGEKNFLDFLSPIEIKIFKLCRINPSVAMDWKQYLIAMFVINSVWLVWGLTVLLFQGKLFLNPACNPSMEWTLALNSAVSFLTSTNLQHYAGETGATYLSQIAVFMFLQFVSAGTSLAVGVAVVRGLAKGSSKASGNFYNDFLKSCTRILLPLCVVAAIIFLLNGVPMTFEGPQQIKGLNEEHITIATGPIAAMIPIKELGSNGGGFFGANDAHPLENPNFITFIMHTVIVYLLPMAFVFMVGYFLKERKLSRMIFGVMTAGVIVTTVPIVLEETTGNPLVKKMGLDVSAGNMEGKETRYGSFYSAVYSAENAAIPAGTIVGMHDSYMPLSAITILIAMNVDAFFGGLGTGWINMFIFLIIAVFIGSLMVGRTPEILGKKIDIPEIQAAVVVTLLSTLVPIGLAAVANFTIVNYPGGNGALSWLTNKGRSHGFTAMLYEYISSTAGNGSEFSSLGANTPYWNLTTSLAMLFGRFVPIVGAVFIAGLVGEKKSRPSSEGTLKTYGLTFGFFLFVVILILNALSMFISLTLGPISEQLGQGIS